MELITIKNVRGYIDKDGTAFLNLEDVARGLGFEREKNGKMYVMWDRVNKYLEELSFHTSVENDFIPENIFYKLCMKANNETARKFQDIVGDEILPAIRKNGGYIVTTDQDDEMTIMSKAILLADKTIKGLKNKIDTLESANNLLKRNKEALRIEKEILEADNEILTAETQIQQQRLSELEPIKEYVDVILASPDALAISQIAADYGMTGRELNDILHKKGVIRKIGGQWILYKKHMNKGYTQSKTYSYKTVFGVDKTNVSTYWTQKGRLKIHEILTAMGIKANCDKVQDN
ncbi:MAG: phage antirepressor KilAC domain-containing protein [Fusobacterium sp.]|uniref:phage antirepressor KilAC domain-containing protein n=1 Tax=Fusobacterium sp. TaxID=68766 RepID=UPI002A752FC9|nr:phage antirepressor KilAC domain-containing protein [Fusobacterium sp.]MDY2980179.1 phage antirepressor KilAC domain-containing protein [Fusobacterium sp.]